MPRMKKAGTLAGVLSNIATLGARTEDAAASLLTLAAGLRTVPAFDAAVLEAYKANGWHGKPGRPSADSDRRAVPHTVRTYVWEVRSAIRDGLDVGGFRSFYALRMARRKAPQEPAAPAASAPAEPGTSLTIPKEAEQDFAGVRVMGGADPNGALFHDLIVCYLNLRPEDRALLSRQLSRLLHKYQPQQLRAA